MSMTVKSALVKDGRPRLWTGIPVGIGLRFATTSIVGSIEGLNSAWLKPIPCTIPAVAVGAVLCVARKTRRAGYGVIIGALASYLYTAVQNTGVEKTVAALKAEGQLSGARGPVQILR